MIRLIKGEQRRINITFQNILMENVANIVIILYHNSYRNRIITDNYEKYACVFAITSTPDYPNAGSITPVAGSEGKYSFLLTGEITNQLRLGIYNMEYKIIYNDTDGTIDKEKLSVLSVSNSVFK